MTNLVNNCPNTVKHQANATQDKARTANKLLTSSADSRNRASSGKPTFSSNMPMDPGMAMAQRRFSILKVIVAPQFLKNCYFKVKLLILTLILMYNYCIMPL